MVDNSRNLETSPEMQGMCIGVKSTSGSVTLGLFLTFLFSFWLSSLFQRAGMFSFFFKFLSGNIYILPSFNSRRVYRGTRGTLTDSMEACKCPHA